MYPQTQLQRLTVRQAALRERISQRRIAAVTIADRAAQPLAWLDRALAFWRGLPPLVRYTVLPLGWLLPRPAGPRPGLLRQLTRWGPLLFVAARTLLRRRPAASS